MIHINNEFALGDIVSLRTSESRGQVAAITINMAKAIVYAVTWNESTYGHHFAGELVLVQAVEDCN